MTKKPDPEPVNAPLYGTKKRELARDEDPFLAGNDFPGWDREQDEGSAPEPGSAEKEKKTPASGGK